MSKLLIANKKTNTLLCGVIVSLGLSGCHTVEGVGTDIKEAGQSLEQSAEQNTSESTHRCPYCLKLFQERKE